MRSWKTAGSGAKLQTRLPIAGKPVRFRNVWRGGALALIAILLIGQIWLLSATREAFLAGHSGPVLPAAIVSGLLFSACLALNFFVNRIDRNSKQV